MFNEDSTADDVHLSDLASQVEADKALDSEVQEMLEIRSASEDARDFEDSMDGDHRSALASAGWGTDEDYEHNLYDDDQFFGDNDND